MSTRQNSISYKEFFSILHNVEVVENGKQTELNAEGKLYLDFHSDRYYRTYHFLKPYLLTDGYSILDIGLSPYFTTALQYLTRSKCSGIWGGYRLDNKLSEKTMRTVITKYKDADYSIPIYEGYNLESDRLPFEDNSFDVVLFLEIIEHFIKDPVFALKELARVLKPNGVLILTTDNSHSFVKLLKFLTFKRIYWPYNDKMFGDRHNREYMQDEIRKLLTGIGFRDVNVKLKNLSPYAIGKYPKKKKMGYAISNMLTNMPYLNKFKRQIFASGRKGTIKDFYPGWLFMRRDGWIESQLE